MTFTWNVVSSHTEPDEQLKRKFRQKIAKLEKHLKHFPPDAVHLQIALERHPKKPIHTVMLTLRVPSHILHTTKSAVEPITAFDEAIKALLRELESFKSGLRGEILWKRRARRELLHQLKAAGFAAEPMIEGAGPQKLEDIVRDLFQQRYNALLRHARRHIRHDELAGDLPKGAVDARDIVDEAAGQAEAKATQKPREMGWLVWFYHLVHEKLRRQRRLFKLKQAKEVSVEKRQILPEDKDSALLPLERIVKRQMEPEVIRTEDIVPNPEAAPPDQIVEQKDMLEYLQNNIKDWPKPEREVFELYFVEGFGPKEIAMITGQPLKNMQGNIASIQHRLREEMLQENAPAGNVHA